MAQLNFQESNKMASPLFSPINGSGVSISVTSFTQNTFFNASIAGTAVLLANTGTKTAFVRLMATSATAQALTSDMPIPGASYIVIDRGAATWVAAICGGTDTTTLQVSVGYAG